MKTDQRIENIYREVADRKQDFEPVERQLTDEEIHCQAERCCNCGIPFCFGTGCPLENVIPDINTAAAQGRWRDAWELLSSTSSFPEFTSRICPALCEGSCTSGIGGESVMVREIEKAVVETAFKNGWVQPPLPLNMSGRSVAVIGAGPAGLAAADRLARLGHTVTVFEKQAAPGGLLSYGIPDFKLEKSVVQRRVDLMCDQGIDFECGTEVGSDISGEYLARRFDAVVVAIGTPEARNLPIPGRELDGVHFALEFLQGQNRLIAGEVSELPIDAAGKRVVVIGGGDTGSDCVGTSLRHGAASVLQLELMPQPPEGRSDSTPWPQWPYMLRTSSSHKEGGARRWNVQTKQFLGKDGRVTGLETCAVEWELSPEGRPLRFKEVPGTAEVLEADLVFLAMGFTGVSAKGLAEELGLAVTPRGQLQPAPERGIFVCGDAAKGASLVVRAIQDGRRAAAAVDAYLKNTKVRQE